MGVDFSTRIAQSFHWVPLVPPPHGLERFQSLIGPAQHPNINGHNGHNGSQRCAVVKEGVPPGEAVRKKSNTALLSGSGYLVTGYM